MGWEESGKYSEAVNAYYSASLMGLDCGENELSVIGSTLAALEILSAKTWWHVKENGKMYEKEFNKGE